MELVFNKAFVVAEKKSLKARGNAAQELEAQTEERENRFLSCAGAPEAAEVTPRQLLPRSAADF